MIIKLTFGCQQPGEITFSMDPNWLTMTFCMGNKRSQCSTDVVCWNKSVIGSFGFNFMNTQMRVPQLAIS